MYRIRPVIVTGTLLVTLLLALLVSLGFWQLDRYDSKRAMETLHQSRQDGSYSLQDIQGQPDPLYFQLSVTGRFDNQRSFLLDNRTHNGRVGFHVLTSFIADTGQTLLVDRGWIAGFSDRSQLPSIPAIKGLVSISGLSWQPAGEAFLLKEDQWQQSWPKIVQAIDQKRMATELEARLQPWLLIQDADQPGSLQRNFHLTNMPATRHMGYAFQWFAMAIALALLGLWALRLTFYKKDRKTEALERPGEAQL